MMKALLFVLFSQFFPAQNSPAPVVVTDADEIRIGQVLAAKYEQAEGLGPTPQIKKIDEYLQRVGDRVGAQAERKLPYRFHFDPSPSFKSAFALPGGQIFVGGGILAYLDTEDQLAAVLGHEIEHVSLNHCHDRLIGVLTEQHLSVNDAKKLKIDAFYPGYGHDKEFAADKEGVRLAMEAGYSAGAAIRLLRTFVILGEQMPNTASEARKNLEERIAQIESLGKGTQLPKPAAEVPLALP